MVAMQYLFTAILAFATLIAAQLQPDEIINRIGALTSRMQDIQMASEEIDVEDALLFIIDDGAFPMIIKMFEELRAFAKNSAESVKGSEKISDEEVSANIVQEFGETMKTMDTFAKKAGVLKDVPELGSPIADELEQSNSFIDLYAIRVDTLFEDQDYATQVEQQIMLIDTAFSMAIKAYRGSG